LWLRLLPVCLLAYLRVLRAFVVCLSSLELRGNARRGCFEVTFLHLFPNFREFCDTFRRLTANCRCELGIPSASGSRLPSPWNDDAVACGLQRGDREAWAALFDQHSDRVWRYVARLVGRDVAAVADVVQETFLAAARSARSFDATRGTLSQWLLGIAHRQTAQHRRQREGVHDSSRTEQTMADSHGDPSALLEQRETADTVRQALAELSADYAVLLVAKYLEDRPVEQLVHEFGGTTEAIRSKLARARREFRAAYERLTRSDQHSLTEHSLKSPHSP
jgi:RNA polymerase sigma-70 factor, ECF subfamily